MKKKILTFGNKQIETENIKGITSALSREKLFNKQGGQAFINYFFLRDFLQQMAQENTDMVITGSTSSLVHAPAFRIPTDLDIKTMQPEIVLELIKHLAANQEIGKYDITQEFQNRDTGVYGVKMKIDVKGVMGKVDFDIAPKPTQDARKGDLKKFISADEVFQVTVPPIEQAIAGKIGSIFDKFIMCYDSGKETHFRAKDLMDLYVLIRQEGVDIEQVNELLLQRFEKGVLYNRTRNYDAIKRARDDMNKEIPAGIDKAWNDFTRHTTIAEGIEKDAVAKGALQSINNLDLERGR